MQQPHELSLHSYAVLYVRDYNQKSLNYFRLLQTFPLYRPLESN